MMDGHIFAMCLEKYASNCSELLVFLSSVLTRSLDF